MKSMNSRAIPAVNKCSKSTQFADLEIKLTSAMPYILVGWGITSGAEIINFLHHRFQLTN